MDYGLVDIEVSSQNREEVEENLLEFIEFFDEHSEEFEKVDVRPEDRGQDNETGTAQTTLGETRQKSESEENKERVFQIITDRIRTDPHILEKFIKVPEDEGRVPYLNLDDFEDEEDVLGSSLREKQARASLVLLYIWKEIREVDEVDSADLNEALHTSRIDPKNRANMYKALGGDADGYFTRSPAGNLGLTQSGERAAVEEIERLAEIHQDR